MCIDVGQNVANSAGVSPASIINDRLDNLSASYTVASLNKWYRLHFDSFVFDSKYLFVSDDSKLYMVSQDKPRADVWHASVERLNFFCRHIIYSNVSISKSMVEAVTAGSDAKCLS